MQTQCLPVTEESLALAARLIREGALVAFPTETVYGLGANALDAEAVARIFEAKGRPADNPLIVHVADREGLRGLVREIPEAASRLMDAFWPGPLTLVLQKTDAVPLCVTAGLQTVAVRCPSDANANAFLRACGLPVAAPSANRSGRPSPTLAVHVREDMEGRIPLILDGGPSQVGLESTVLSVLQDQPLLLRPGGITKEMLEGVLGREVAVSHGVLQPLGDGEKALSPGMKHTHYKPRATVRLFYEGDVRAKLSDAYAQTLARGGRPVLLCLDAMAAALPACASLPAGRDAAALAAHLFSLLREADERGFDTVLMQGVDEEGIGLAVMNRALRAAGFDVT